MLLTAWAVLWLVIVTLLMGSLVIILALAGVPENRLQWIPRLWARLVIWGACCRVAVEGRENLEPDQTYVFACNHTSALDIPALSAGLPRDIRWIGKKELFGVPIFGQAMLRVGYIPIDRSNARAALKSLNLAAGRIQEGASVLIFPEGTRSTDGRLLPFKSGGLALAIRSGRPVAPAAILGAGQALPPNTLRLNPGLIRIRLGKPVPTEGLKMRDRDQLAALLRDKVQELIDSAD
jgi:1-acyl-sn-glycerol-3-phosphate acyltransferase